MLKGWFIEVSEIILSGKYDVLVLDEAHIANYYRLFGVEELMDLLKGKPEGLEVIITGRYAPDQLIEFADLVTEMKEINHYYTKGIQARIGIKYPFEGRVREGLYL
ncbi:cob(I)yrinic acid a,c-diamide adenosyltransferase [Maribacter aquimaris]|uniref:cob(I)yrinic acid a,c-diamide adenosyltransferase n=1 Tax=Maribacter aquimaris TaxID=2737171 RepID=UPI001CB753C1|nr:cob(I)yrinic acid a,c-diamide adenosyltransferase [Maribacter aquimaris]